MAQNLALQLTDLQEEAYMLLQKERIMPYDREHLKEVLNFNSTKAVTQSYNALLKKGLIEFYEEGPNGIFVRLIEAIGENYSASNSKESTPSINQPNISNYISLNKSKTVDCSDTHTSEFSTTLKDSLPKNVLNVMQKIATEQPVIELNHITIADLTEKHYLLLDSTLQHLEKHHRPLPNNSAQLTNLIQVSTETLNQIKRDLTFLDLICLSSHPNHPTTQFIEITNVGRTILQRYLTKQKESTPKKNDTELKQSINSVNSSSEPLDSSDDFNQKKLMSLSNPDFMKRIETFKTQYLGLENNELFVYQTFVNHFLNNKGIQEVRYTVLNRLTDISSLKLSKILNNLKEKGFVQIEGTERSLIKPVHTRMLLTIAFEDLPLTGATYSEEIPQKPVSEVKSFVQSIQIKPTLATSQTETSSPKESNLCCSDIENEPKIKNEVVYFIDTENTGLNSIFQPNIIERLNLTDKVILMISEKTARLTPEQLHLLTSKPIFETEFIQVQGRGQNDLDHALIAELTLRLIQDPHRYFVIISHDQGYRGAMLHLTRKLKLKPDQLRLTPYL